MSDKPRYKTYTPHQSDPLFIRFVNGDTDPRGVVQGLIEGTRDEGTIGIAQEVLAGEMDLTQFREDLCSLLDDIIANGVYHPAVNYLNSYMEPSILEHQEERNLDSSGTTRKWLSIRKKDSPWVEAVVCYNLTLFIKAFGFSKIKKCPQCHRYFTQKKFKYKFCSEKCKMRSGE